MTEQVKSLPPTLKQYSRAKDDVEKFIRLLKQYAEAPELTRGMCVDLIGYNVVGDFTKDKSVPRNI